MSVALEILVWVVTALAACVLAVMVMFSKRLATWLGRTIGNGIIETLRAHWSADMADKLLPIYRELQIGDGTDKWPNGSDTLPQTMETIYRRQKETHEAQGEIRRMVGEMQTALEQVLTSRPPRPDPPEGTPEGF